MHCYMVSSSHLIVGLQSPSVLLCVQQLPVKASCQCLVLYKITKNLQHKQDQHIPQFGKYSTVRIFHGCQLPTNYTKIILPRLIHNTNLVVHLFLRLACLPFSFILRWGKIKSRVNGLVMSSLHGRRDSRLYMCSPRSQGSDTS